MRRVLHAWKRDSRISEHGIASWSDTSVPNNPPILEESAPSLLIWPPPDLNDDLPAASDTNDPAMVAWNAISDKLPQLGRLVRLVTPVGLVGNVLTVSVSDARTYSVLTNTQRHLVEYVTRNVLGDDASLNAEMVERKASAA